MQDIGAKLKAKREELGYRLEDIVEKTKLHPSALHDIEEGNLANISPAYLRGFLRIYAKFLGVDIDLELKDIPSAQNIDKKTKPVVPKIPVQKPVIPAAKPAVPSANKSIEVKTSINLKTTESNSSSHTFIPAQKPWVKPHASVQEQPENNKPIISISLPPQALKSIGIAIAAVLALVIISRGLPAISQKMRADHMIAVQKAKLRKAEKDHKRAVEAEKKRRTKEQRMMEKKRIQAQKDAAKRAAAATRSSQTSSVFENTFTAAAPQSKSKETVVSLTTKKDCFVRAIVDGKTVLESVLRKGVAETWRAKKEVELKLSDGSAVIVEINGAMIPPLSASPRAIKSVKINSKGITVNK